MPNSLGFKKRDMNKENSNVNGFDFAHHCPEQRRTDKCQMSNLVLILIFLIWKTFDTWVLFFAAKIIPYLGFFPYPKELFDFGLRENEKHTTDTYSVTLNGRKYKTILK